VSVSPSGSVPLAVSLKGVCCGMVKAAVVVTVGALLPVVVSVPQLAPVPALVVNASISLRLRRWK